MNESVIEDISINNGSTFQRSRKKKSGSMLEMQMSCWESFSMPPLIFFFMFGGGSENVPLRVTSGLAFQLPREITVEGLNVGMQSILCYHTFDSIES